MSSVYFISDLHLGHKNICKFRPFDSLEEHDSMIKESLLSTVNRRDKLFLLGDIAFTDEAGDWIVNELHKYCSNIVIVLGNHDTDSKERFGNIVKYVNAGIKMHGLTTYKDAWLSHCPIHPDEIRKKSYCVHGHVHSNNIQTRYDGMALGDDQKYFNVSCENVNYKPIRYDEIKEKLL